MLFLLILWLVFYLALQKVLVQFYGPFSTLKCDGAQKIKIKVSKK